MLCFIKQKVNLYSLLLKILLMDVMNIEEWHDEK